MERKWKRFAPRTKIIAQGSYPHHSLSKNLLSIGVNHNITVYRTGPSSYQALLSTNINLSHTLSLAETRPTGMFRLNRISPSAGNLIQSTPHPATMRSWPCILSGNPSQSTRQFLLTTQSPHCITLDTVPSSIQTFHLPAPATTCKKTRDPAKALEKAVENKATDYGFDSDTIKLRAYANAREKGIEAPEPQEAESQHIIYEFQKVRRQHSIYTTLPDRFPESVKLLPGQTRYDRVGLRHQKTLEKRDIQRRTYHDKNRQKWSAAALSPLGGKPLGITKARPVKHNNITAKAPSPVHKPNASISAPSKQPNFTPADTIMCQTMCSQPFNFANSTTTPPAMTLNGAYGPSYPTHPIAAPTVMTQTISNQPFSLAEPRVAPQPAMQIMGNEPSGTAIPPVTTPTTM